VDREHLRRQTDSGKWGPPFLSAEAGIENTRFNRPAFLLLLYHQKAIIAISGETIMATVNIADLKNNLSAYLEQVKNGEELIVKDRNRPVARLVPLTAGEDLDAEEESLVAAGLMRLPIKKKSDDYLSIPAPQVTMADIRAVIRAERDED
jgi:prevent-host-death family protein